MSQPAAVRRVNQRADIYRLQYQVDGTSAYVPARVATGRTKVRRRSAAAAEQKSRSSFAAGRTYVLFLTLISVACVYMCVHYLQLKEQSTWLTGQNERLESQLTSLRSENDALYETVVNSVDWNYIRETAITELGMKYAAEEQIVWYNSKDSSYVRQYMDVD